MWLQLLQGGGQPWDVLDLTSTGQKAPNGSKIKVREESQHQWKEFGCGLSDNMIVWCELYTIL